jgi:deoxycytidylate deaminase
LLRKKLIDESDREVTTKTIRESRVGQLIEFSRAAHAEVHSIVSALQQSGGKVIGGKLYCTTYPCHSCARLIILAGISEVFYIEPYRKSLAVKLHGDAITEVSAEVSNRVQFLPYDGIAPGRYLDMFRVRDGGRKRHGSVLPLAPMNARPPYDVTLESIPTLESVVVRKLPKALIEKAEEGHG